MRIGELGFDPNNLKSVAEALTLVIRVVDRQIEFGNPQGPTAATDLAGTTHNGTLMNIKGSWVELEIDTRDLAFEVNHNLAVPVFDGEMNVRWFIAGVRHDGTAAGVSAVISFNHEDGDAITENMFELRCYANGRTVDADHPVRVTLFVIPANRWAD